LSALRTLRALLTCWLARLSSAQTGAVLVYHRVAEGDGGDPSREILAALAKDDFERHIRHLRRHYRVVHAADLIDAARSRRRWRRFPVAVTFDDDLASHVRTALPALRRAEVTATFFLGGTTLDGARSFWWHDLQDAIDERLVVSLPHVADTDLRAALERVPKAIFRVAGTIERLEPSQRDEVAAALRAAVGSRAADPGLRAADVQALVAGGCTVGFHTLRHDALPALGDDALDDALHDGRDTLAAVVGAQLDTISYPYGKADDRVARAAHAAGFTHGFVTGRRGVTPDTDPLLIPRIPPAPSLGKTALRVAQAVASSGPQ
jgi:peptidoglycan/xylan/chitin deacetylase (PgdA/CDA1 family)